MGNIFSTESLRTRMREEAFMQSLQKHGALSDGDLVIYDSISDEYKIAKAKQAQARNNPMDRIALMSEDIGKHPVYQMTVQALTDLWLTRYGHDWVDADDVANDPFYSHAMKRLHGLGVLEYHYLSDRQRYVCRKPE